MADLDTAAKRRAAVQFLPWMVMPIADSVIDDHDRAQAAGIYSGIAINFIVVVVNEYQNTTIFSLTVNLGIESLTPNTTVFKLFD